MRFTAILYVKKLLKSPAMAFDQYLRPIFHCDAKYLASGVGVGQYPRRQNFVLEIPTCWYILALPNAKICVSPNANPQRQKAQRHLYSTDWRYACTFHVVYVNLCRVCVGCPTQTRFSVEYGLKMSDISCVTGTFSYKNWSHCTVGTPIFDEFQ